MRRLTCGGNGSVLVAVQRPGHAAGERHRRGQCTPQHAGMRQRRAPVPRTVAVPVVPSQKAARLAERSHHAKMPRLPRRTRNDAANTDTRFDALVRIGARSSTVRRTGTRDTTANPEERRSRKDLRCTSRQAHAVYYRACGRCVTSDSQRSRAHLIRQLQRTRSLSRSVVSRSQE